jgi:hypothetical protein
MKIKIIEDFVWLVVTPKDARRVLASESLPLDLYVLHGDGSESLIESAEALEAAILDGLEIGVEAGSLTPERDLFETPDEWPDDVAAILSGIAEGASYDELRAALEALEPLGYTFEFDLSCEPFNLKKI